MDEFYYITTPIYYVNARPHLGHIYTTVISDIMANYQRQKGYNVFFLTGVDEHGDKIVKAAKAESKSPSEYVDEISHEFKGVWEKLNISNSDFIRTTEDRHKKYVQLVLQKLYDKGDIYLSSYEGNYCFGCERYLTDKELTEDGKCPDHQLKPEIIKEENYFFKLQKYIPLWEEILVKNPDLIRPDQYYREILGTLQELKKQGEDLSITRPVQRLSWGIPTPFDSKYVTYVWFDALLNYISALQSNGEDNYKKYWPVAHHVIAKDILKPHGIYWPAMLLAADIKIFQTLFVHGYWLGINDLKMSKSLNNALNPMEIIQITGLDAFRYFLAREMNFGNDSRYSDEIMQNRINVDLSNGLGNLIQRTLTMIKKYEAGKIPERTDEIKGIDKMILDISNQYHKQMNLFQFSRALESVFQLVNELNRMIEEKKPWEMSKSNPESLSGFLRLLMDGIGVTMKYLKPFLPEKFKVFEGITGLKSTTEFPESFALIQYNEKLPDTWPILFPRLALTENK